MLRGLKEAKPKFPAVTSLPCTLVSVNSATPWQFLFQEKAEVGVGSAGLFLCVGLTQ